MGMSTHIKAFIPDTDKEYQKHLKVYRVCNEAKVSLPKETEEYFDGCDEPEDKLEFELVENQHYIDWGRDMEEGFEVDLSRLPPSVTKLRFYNSY